MDAASHTGIDDVREIIESARYKPVMARTKVYIIDEVHMLSKQAFNGLLKTLEEPPDHVKFLFATTEIEKVPVTVRSRCQRFDLRRVEAGCADRLSRLDLRQGGRHHRGRGAEPHRARGGRLGARRAVAARSGDRPWCGPRRGAPGATITRKPCAVMLGLADRGRIIDLFEALMRGQMAEALGILKELHDFGADPSEVLASLAEFVHLVTRLKLVPEAAQDASLTPDERTPRPAICRKRSRCRF